MIIHSVISIGRGFLRGDLENVLFRYIFTMKMNSNYKALCHDCVNNQNINVLKLLKKFDWSRSLPTTLTSPSIWVIGISPFFPYRPSLRFQAQVPRTLYVHVYESPIQIYAFEACWDTFGCNYIFKCEFGYFKRLRSTSKSSAIKK
jgi:hypothetical protein